MNAKVGAVVAILGMALVAAVASGVLNLSWREKLLLWLVLIGIGLLASALLFWWDSKKKKAQAAAAPAGGDAGAGDAIEALIREAEGRLAASKAAPGGLGSLPLYFVIGEQGSTKTSIMVHSGLEAELLAGQVYQDTAIVPTRSINIWFAKGSLFVEPGSQILSDPAAWAKLLKRLQPGKLKTVVGASGQAPRAALVFFDCDTFIRPGGADAVTVSSRKLQARLGEMSQVLGISFPVYVLFSKADRLPFLADYVRNLSNEEVTQVVGATLPMRDLQAGVYAEEETRRITSVVDGLYYSFADKRLEVLPREADASKLPGAYEFPREFRKLRQALVPFLVDLCRPSQLRTSPFLRGFYFCGVRPVFVQEAAPSPVAPQQSQQAVGSAASATQVFQVSMQKQAAMQAQAAIPQAGVRKVPQWIFITRLFQEILLKDSSAMSASGASVKTSFAQRLLLAAAALIAVVFIAGFTVSFLNNRSLENDAILAAQGAAPPEVPADQLPKLEQLQKLDTLRQSLERLRGYQRDGAPFGMRWFLFAGDDMYPHVRRIYYDRFRRLLFGSTQAGILGKLAASPDMPGPTDNYDYAYNSLKAYLITTSEHPRSTREYLPPVLMDRWAAGRDIPIDIRTLAQKQFEFYADDLKTDNPYSKKADEAAVDKSRRYLAKFSGSERVYAFMLSEAGKKNAKVNYNAMFPGSDKIIVNAKDVQGAFTKGGWTFMQDAFKNIDRFFSGEPWVLGNYAGTSVDKAKLAIELSDRYNADYIKAWRDWLRVSSFQRYENLKDASTKLQSLSGNQTPLLALVWLMTQHTAVDNPKVADAFKAAHLVVTPPATAPQYVLPPNQNYMAALLNLQAQVDTASNEPQVAPATASATLGAASQAKMTTRQMAQTFPADPEGQVSANMQKLLEEPITSVEALLKGLGPAELNGKAKGLCAQFSAVTSKFPFNPKAVPEASLEEVAALLRPKTGALWQFYDASLVKLLAKNGADYTAVPGEITLTPGFVNFFNQAAKFSDALYPGGAPDPKFAYTLRFVQSDQVQAANLTIDGQSAKLTGGQAYKYTWPGARAMQLSLKLQGGTDIDVQTRDGLWAVFRFFADADTFTRSGAAYTLEFMARTGREGRPMMVGGKPLVYRFNLDTGGAPPIFNKDWLAAFRCSLPAAK
ncbi:MAG: ImcF-related family protein [Bryobacteraceae bacterium]|nr:ImcF-related family protein [Bryobacteraceae bacterium]